MKGTIKALNISYGFIKIEGKDDLFFHETDVVGETNFKNLNEGDEVEFEEGSGDKGPKAIKVKKAE